MLLNCVCCLFLLPMQAARMLAVTAWTLSLDLLMSLKRATSGMRWEKMQIG